jgi:hypothetical protein
MMHEAIVLGEMCLTGGFDAVTRLIQNRVVSQVMNYRVNLSHLDKTTILLGYLDQEYLIPINFILIMAKYYIFLSIYNNKLLNYRSMERKSNPL